MKGRPAVEQREMNWFTMGDDYGNGYESLGFFPLEQTADGDFICPKCGKPATYWEGQLNQDCMGSAIIGWSYDCWDCHIYTGAHEI